MFGVVQLKHNRIGQMKRNWAKEQLVATLLVERSRGFMFYNPTIKSFFETGNARFSEDVEFGGDDNIRSVGFLF